jgi:predicted alpha-1,2-mannosidase
LPPYQKYGYIPAGKGEVSNTLEYAYDDWALSQMAQTLGKHDDADYFMRRSENWRNIFDTVSGFIRPKNEAGAWIEPFDPYHTPGFVEGNAFNYTWFVPQNPHGLIEAMGRERFIARLDEAMEKSSRANFNAAGDDFSNYPINHGNETSMEVTALFNWAGAPWLTQKWVRAIQEQYYGVTPYDAYPGDEDLGQMSGWFVMSALGLFQLDGGCSQNPVYELTSPRYPKAVIRLDGKYGRGQTFVIEAKNASKENKYIQKVELNGQPVNDFRIPQSEVLKGGHLTVEMGASPPK